MDNENNDAVTVEDFALHASWGDMSVARGCRHTPVVVFVVGDYLALEAHDDLPGAVRVEGVNYVRVVDFLGGTEDVRFVADADAVVRAPAGYRDARGDTMSLGMF